MKSPNPLERQHRMLHYLSHMPRRILDLPYDVRATEFVLHDLCHKHCFDIDRAAYFVDNPDFNCLQGVAGFSREEAYPRCDHIWEEPTDFMKHMQHCPFNQKVQQIMRCSIKKAPEADEDLAAEIARELGFKKHQFCSWNMKHDNHGLFVYEPKDENDDLIKEYLIDGVTLLSFCPVF